MFNLVICCNLHRSFLIQVSTSTKCNLYIISIPCRTGTLFMATKEPPLLTLKTLSNVCNHSVLIYISYDRNPEAMAKFQIRIQRFKVHVNAYLA